MNNFKNIKKTLTFKTEGKIPYFDSDKIAILNISLLLFVFFIGGVSIYFTSTEIANPFVLVISIVVACINYIFLKIKKNVSIASGVFLFLLLGILAANLLIYSNELFTLVTIALLPLYSLVLLGVRKGSLLFVLEFIAILLVFVFTEKYKTPEYTKFKQVSLLILFSGWLIVSIFLIVYNLTINKLQDKLKKSEEQLKEKDKFLSKLSYQIRIPLNNINGAIDLISVSKLNPEQLDLLNTIKASSNNLINIIDYVGDVSNFETQIKEYTEEEFNIFETIKNTFNIYFSKKDSKINIKFNFSDKVPKQIIGQPVKLKQILLNIVEFFIKYYPDDELPVNINFLLDINKESEDKLNLLFEFQTETPLLIDVTSYNSRNSGTSGDMDYLITRTLIDSLNGSMNLLSNPFETKLSYTLEYNKAEQTDKKKDKPENGQMPHSNKVNKDKKITGLNEAEVLIVEDNLINQKIMVLSLKKIVNNIVIANNGQEALDAMNKQDFHIVLMDIQMPVMDGLEASMRIRKEEKDGQQIPIIAITANALHGDRESCLAAGMNDYISKPFKLEVLLEKMKQHLNVPA